MTPNAVNLMLVDYTLDILFDELSDLSKALAKEEARRARTLRREAATQQGPGQQEQRGEEPLAYSEPGSRMYFLTWCIGAMLKTLCLLAGSL